VPIDNMEVQAVPRFRSGMLLDFAVERPQAVLLAIVLDRITRPREERRS